MSLKSVIAN